MTPSTDTFHGWGKWSPWRELARGIFHASIGIIGWIVLHPLQVDQDLITFLLFVVAGSFIVLDLCRLGVARSQKTHFFARFLKWINNKMVRKLLTRDTEKVELSATVPSVLGLSVGWLLGSRWICAAGSLYFGLIDPLAKLGRYLPIKRFATGRAAGKSLGGILFGLLGGVAGLTLIFITNAFFVPLFPLNITIWQAVCIFTIGLVTASLAELFGGKLDNFFIPAGSIGTMALFNTLLFS